jgi:ribose-phosphate pyrophosphokinase
LFVTLAELAIVPGSAHPALATDLAGCLGAPALAVERERFPDGELFVRLGASVRGRTAVIVQPTGPPVDEHLVELLAVADACRRAAAERIVAVVPYFGYARGDRRAAPGTPIMASLVARLIERAGVEQVVTVDLHAPQIEGFFDIPIEDLATAPVLLPVLREIVPSDVIVVSPDLGRIGLATSLAEQLGTTAAVVHKQRTSARASRARRVVGDVAGRACLIPDDMIATGGTIRVAVEALLAAGARPDVTVAASHGLFLPGAADQLSHPAIRRIVVTDSLPQASDAPPERTVVPIAPLLADAIRAIAAPGG